MTEYYIFDLKYKEAPVEEKIPNELESHVVSATIIFCDKKHIDQEILKSEIRTYYQKNYQTDKIFVIGGDYLKNEMKRVFIDEINETFIGIPKRQETHLLENLHLITFNIHGKLKGDFIPNDFAAKFKNEGLQNIFKKRGGLIISPGSHHFVFPSGKHCDRFLRTGNILLVSPEIYFIAFCLIEHFNFDKHDCIYCDTSSINSVAFALLELKNRFLALKKQKHLSINSFSSYDGLQRSENGFKQSSFIIISASTSGRIVEKILEEHRHLQMENMVILFYLGSEKHYNKSNKIILCNLTKSESNLNGIEHDNTGENNNASNCEYCKRGSYAVEVSGDVFLLEKPQINKILIKTSDADKRLAGFVKQFNSSRSSSEKILKVNFKENSDGKYEVFIDFLSILKGINSNNHNQFKNKLNNYIYSHIPASTKVILSLNDEASIKFAEYIHGIISKYYNSSSQPRIITQEELSQLDNVSDCSILIAASCISNGKNLLYISRALRKFNNLNIVYFIGIARTKDIKHLEGLKNNLTKSKPGAKPGQFVYSESIFCSNKSRKTPWIDEIDFLKRFIDIMNDNGEYEEVVQIVNERIEMLSNSSSRINRGLSNELFWPQIIENESSELKLRKNFAFIDFDDHIDKLSQADTYFTISNIINSLRNSEETNRTLKQSSVYTRNLLDPENFNRFNDGVIQASILRSAQPEELAYVIDTSSSIEMYHILQTIIKYHKNTQGEALLEFLYAIAINKLTLKVIHIEKLVESVNKYCSDKIYLAFALYIKNVVLKKA